MNTAWTGEGEVTQLYCLRSGPAVRGNGKAYYKLGISKQIDERVANINRDLRKLALPRAEVVEVWSAEEVYHNAEFVEQTALAYLEDFRATGYPGCEWRYCSLKRIREEVEDALIDAQNDLFRRSEAMFRRELRRVTVPGDVKATKAALLDSLFGPEMEVA